jgi:hypothetical protein
MGYRGDLVMPASWSQVTIRMSTAIMLAYSPDGFVIAADGLQKNSYDPNKFNPTTQKIFDLSYGRDHIAFSLSGVAQYTAAHSDSVVFDFNEEALAAAASLHGRHCKKLGGYAVRLSRIINERLRIVASHGSVSDFEGSALEPQSDAKTIAVLTLAGYYNTDPQIAVVYFRHKDQRLHEPEICQYPASSGRS